VGYGLGTSQFDIAGGALLLYLTNLGGIVLVSVVIFLMVGFRPTRAERGAKARQATVVAVSGLLLVAIPLALTTVNIAREQSLRAEIHHVLGQLDAEVFGINRYSIEMERGRFVVTGTVYAYGKIEPDSVEMVQRKLEGAVGVPIELRVTIVPATLTVVGGGSEQRAEREPEVVPSSEGDHLDESSEETAIEPSAPESSEIRE
jgi:uncharacterized membrane protein